MKRIKLDDLSKKAPFQVPEGYFDQLTVDIQSKIKEKSQRQWSPSPRLRWALVSVAMIVLVATLWIFNQQEQPATATDLLAEVNEQALLDYLEVTDLTAAELLDGLSEDDLEQLWADENALEELELETEALDELIEVYETEGNLL